MRSMSVFASVHELRLRPAEP